MPKTALSPHDRYIRSVMANTKVAKEFFDRHLPASLRARINLDSLTPHKESFITDKLRLRMADLLYTVEIEGRTGYLYLLLEHASTPDRWLPFRLLKYMTAIMDHHVTKRGEKTLPLVYPLVLYTGKKPFYCSMDMFTLFGAHQDAAREMFLTPFPLINLTAIPDQTIATYAWFQAAALFAKHIHAKDLFPVLPQALKTLRALEQEGEMDYICLTFNYVAEASSFIYKKKFLKALAEGLTPVAKEEVMTLAEYLRREGIEQVARSMLADNFSLDTIAKHTGLTIKRLERLKK